MKRTKQLIISLLTLLCCSTGAWALQQDSEGYYLLGSIHDWKDFAALVQTTPTAKARMTADIDLGDDQTTIGSGNTNAANANVMFRGIFDGNGHTLTVNYNTSEGFYAPFRHIYGATIKNLHVTGSIISSGGRVGGIVCGVFGGSSTQSKIEKCRSSVVITSNCQLSNNDAESVGGIVGQVGFSSRLSIEDCIFDGEITGHVSNVIWSGLVGVLDGTVNTTRCLQAGSFNDLDNGTTSNSATIVCRWQNAATSIVTMDETYYIHPFKTVQGTQATTAQLADGTITTALNAGRTGDETVWVQQGDQPMLKIFTQESEPVEPTVWENGVLPGEFTINANGDQIVFSQGNLQYFCSTTAPQWRFAEHQYDYVAFDISAYAANSGKWIDLFAHGTSGYDNGQTNFQPYVVGAAADTYYQGNLTGNADWGYNAISNGGNSENCGWRTLTRDEWIYLFSGRPNAASKYGHGSINGINGMILLPDSWTLPDGLIFTPGNQAWGKNTYTIDQWTMMEDAGAVFLPASGSCNSQGIPSESTQNQNGFYRASTAAYYLHFRQGTLQNCTASFYQYGDAVRLVKDKQLEQDCTLEQDAEGYYLLSTAQDMRDFAALVNDGNNTANAKVMNDIDLAGDEDNQWTPIGTNSNWYKGTFDGQGYTIRNLYWHSTVNGVVGLFAYADGATIKNLRVEGDMDNNSNSTTTGEQHTGGIVGYSRNSTLVINCSFAGTAKFLYDGGGIVGLGNSRIVNCYNEGTISFPSKTNYSGGGILGYTRDGATIVNCYNAGSVINTLNYTGYIYPIGSGTLNSCYYRENCVKNGQSAGWSNGSGGGTAMSADDMKSESFISTLNANVASLRATYPDICEWKLNSDGYPVHANRKVIEMTPYAIWCEGNKTLYFDYIAQELAAGDIYDGQIITAVWSGEDVTKHHAWKTPPAWSEYSTPTDYVVFKEGFSALRPTSLSYWFERFKMYEIIGIENLNTSQVTDMSHMFDGCTSLRNLDVSGFNTSQVTDMSYMFHACERLHSLDVSGFDTQNVTTMDNMFDDCLCLESIDVSGFNTSQVTDMDGMFGSCGSLESIDVRGFNTSQVTKMDDMFQHCKKLTSIDLSHFDTSQVTDMDFMFYNCQNLKTIYVGDLWTTSNVSLGGNMFYNCVSLVGGDGTLYDENYTNKTKAYAGDGGYLTYSPAYLVGDTNGNGEVEIGDVTSVLTLMAMPEATGYNNKAADANGNGEIEIGDVTTILTIMANGE